MNKFLLFLLVLTPSLSNSYGQAPENKILFIVDSIPVIEDPEEGNEILQTDIADIIIIKNKDSLKLLGYEQFDGVTYIFTKEYRNRSDDLKKIPSSKQMKRKNDAFYLNGTLYSGELIDYYYSGRKQGEGVFINGKANGHRKMYFQNGKVSDEREYAEGIENGLELEYYEDGSLKQKGVISNGKENGIWEMYFPNGQLKQRSHFNNGQMEGETTVYYSTGKVLAVEITKNGKTTPDPRLEKISQVMQKGHDSNKEKDYKNAIKYYSKTIELDSTFAEAYFSRGTVKLNDFKFDDAIGDFDIALKYEPYMGYALANRAFARIRKYQLGNSRIISKNNDVTVLASKDKVPIPPDDQGRICSDLKKAVFLGDKSKMITEALTDYCQ